MIAHIQRDTGESVTVSGTPVVTGMRVVPVAGHDSMLLNLSGARGPFFTRNVVILRDSVVRDMRTLWVLVTQRSARARATGLARMAPVSRSTAANGFAGSSLGRCVTLGGEQARERVSAGRGCGGASLYK